MPQTLENLDVYDIIAGFEDLSRSRGEVSLMVFDPALNEASCRILRDAVAAKIAVEDNLIVDIQFSHSALETTMEVTVIGNFVDKG